MFDSQGRSAEQFCQPVTPIVGNSTASHINIMESMIKLLLEHASHCDDAAHEVARKFKELGIEA